MAGTYLDLQEAITDFLRTKAPQSGTITWGTPGSSLGTPGSPYYEERPEGISGLNYVEFEIDRSKVVDAVMGAGGEGAYLEEYSVSVRVIADQSSIASLTSPYAVGSVGYIMDGAITNPHIMDGLNFFCDDVHRDGWEIHEDKDHRDTTLLRVWIGTLHYTIKIEMPYPPAA
jgi:hypothetical protein